MKRSCDNRGVAMASRETEQKSSTKRLPMFGREKTSDKAVE